MRYLYLCLIVLITLCVVMFKVQNIETVTISFLSSSLTMPLALVIFGMYFLGMLTGGMLVSVIRSWIRGATRPVKPKV